MTPPGGKREGAGRPPKPERERKDVIVRVRVTEAEWREIERLREHEFRAVKPERWKLIQALYAALRLTG